MSDAVAALRSRLPPVTLRTVATAPFRPRTYGNLVYLALAFPLGLAEFLFLTIGLSLGAGLSVLLVGIPLLVVVLLGTVVLASAERLLAVYLLGVDVDPPDWKVLADTDDLLVRLKGLVTDSTVWLGVVFLLSRLFVGVGAFTLLLTLLIPSGVLLATPLYYDTPGVDVGLFLGTDITQTLSVYVPWNELLVGVEFVVRFTSWQVDSLPDAVAMSLLGVVVLVLSINVLNGAAWLCGEWARLLLGPGVPSHPILGRLRSIR